MRLLILPAGPTLFLAACGNNGEADTAVNADEALSTETFSSNDLTAIDAVTGDASNMAADVNFVADLGNDLDSGLDGDDAAPAKSTAARRSPGDSASAPAPEPAVNNSAAATANNAL